MRVLASLSTVAVTTVVLASCGLDMGGIADGPSTEGGPTLDSSITAEGGSSSGGSSGGSGSGGHDGSTDGIGPGDSSSGGGDSTMPPQDSSGADSGSPVDSSTPDTYVVDTGPPPCTVANGCYVIPGGWQLVPFGSYTSTPPPCPTGFTNAQPTNLVEGPNAGSLCTCGACSNMSPGPTCTGAVGVYYDTGGGNCGSPGQPSQNNNTPPGQCGTDLYLGGNSFLQPSYTNLDLKYVPPTTLTGGQCTSKGAASSSPTYAATDRACTPDNGQSGGCSGSQCTPTFPSPFKVCVAKNGTPNCPGAPFTNQHIVGTSATFTCSDCGCGVTGTCSAGGTMKLFTDGNCKNNELDLQADGNCHPSNAPSDTYGSYKYAANPPVNIGCQSSGSSNATNVTLANELTICCAP